MSIGPPIPEIQHFQNLTLKIQGQGQMTMMLQNFRSRQFHRTSNGINPSSGFRDMSSAESDPSAAWCDVFGSWASPYGANGQIKLHNYRYRQVYETLNGVNLPSGSRDMRSAKSGSNLWQIWQVLAHGQVYMGQMGKWPWQCTTTGLDNSTELWTEKISPTVTDGCGFPKSGSRPPGSPPGPWWQYHSSPEGWGVKL